MAKINSDTGLNERQIRFCKEYIACKFNGTQAAINAGYSEKTAVEIASENLIKPNIQKYLSELIEKADEKLGLGISRERTLIEIARIAYSDIRKFYDEDGNLKPISKLDDDAAAVLAGFEVMEEKGGDGEGHQVVLGITKKIRTYDKNKSLEMLAKHFKIYSDAPINNNSIRFGYGKEEPV